MKKLILFFAFALFGLGYNIETKGQGNGKAKGHDKQQKELKDEKKGSESSKVKNSNNQEESNNNKEVKLPANNSFPNPFPGTPPRQIKNVPPGHYPPQGECRIWYPNRPPGQQPPSQSCLSLQGLKLAEGVFILHGDKAYDSKYNWVEYEKKYPGTIAEEVLDIIFPTRKK